MMADKKKYLTQIMGPDEEGGQGEASLSDLESIAEELIDAVITHDVKGAVAALRAFFYVCDSVPHEEGPHTGEE